MGKQWKHWQTWFSWPPKSLQMVTAIMKLKDTCSLGRKATDKLSITRSRDITANKGPYSQSYGFSSSHVWMGELNYKEGWVLKNWCFPMVVLEKPLESPLDSKEIKPVSPKGNQPWIFFGRTGAEAEAPNTLATWCRLQYFGHLFQLTLWKSPWC